MYVAYWKPMNQYYTSYCGDMNPSGLLVLYGSECVWIIPGTVGVDD